MGAEGQQRLLIVDDTETFRTALAAEAAASGRFVSVATAPDGQQALDLINVAIQAGTLDQLPHVVITDLYMPNLNGVELMGALKRHPLTAGIMGVMVSVCDSPAERTAAREAGCRAFFLKPADTTGMRGLLEAAAWLAVGRLQPAGSDA